MEQGNGKKQWTHSEYTDLIITINKLLLNQENINEKIDRLTNSFEKIAEISSIIPKMHSKIDNLEQRIINLEDTKTDTFSFILKTVGSLVLLGAIYAFIVFKKG